MNYTVYLRTNKVNGKQYVGQTKNFTEREKQWNVLTTRYANKLLTKNRQAHLGMISPKRKPVIQLTLDYGFVKEFTHCGAAAKEMGFKCDESIRKACVETWRTSGGFKWMYKDDYEKLLEDLASQELN